MLRYYESTGKWTVEIDGEEGEIHRMDALRFIEDGMTFEYVPER